MTLFTVLFTGLLYGGLISMIMTASILVTFRWNPEIWVHDAPPRIRERYGPVSDQAKRDGRRAAIPTFAMLAAVLVSAVVNIYQRANGAPSFWSVFLTLFVAMQTFDMFDLLVIDWLVVATLRPRALLIPGTESWEGYADYGFYFRGFLKGFVGITVTSLVIAALTVLIVRGVG